MWWDTRKLAEPTEVLILDLWKTENLDEPEWVKWARSHGVFCMDYDPSIPIRFMVCIVKIFPKCLMLIQRLGQKPHSFYSIAIIREQ